MNALDQWARDFGYNDFDTFARAGGSRTEAFADISKRIRGLQSALDLLANVAHTPPPPPTQPALVMPDVAETDVDPPDPANAQVQGDELA